MPRLSRKKRATRIAKVSQSFPFIPVDNFLSFLQLIASFDPSCRVQCTAIEFKSHILRDLVL